MSGSKKRNKAKAKKLRATVRRERSRSTRRRRKRFLKWGVVLTVLALIISLPPTLSVLTAKIPITPLGSIDQAKPMAARFQVANEGSFSIYDVNAEFLLSGQWGFVALKNISVDTIKPPWVMEIQPGSKPVTFVGSFLSLTPGARYESDFVDVTVKISFRSSFTWWRRIVLRRFFAQRNQTGEMDWIEIPTTPGSH